MKTIIPTVILSILLSCFTIANEIEFKKIQDWSPSDTISVYDSSNLWEYINGAADLFIVYGFQNLYSCEMSSGEVEVVVDVYNMGNPLNAFGIYKTERGDIKDKLDIGVEAVITSPSQSLMLKDIYYVKLNIYEGDLTTEQNKGLLQSIAEILPGRNNFPQEFELLPAENKLKDSEHFARESFIGLSELKNCLYADYKIGENSFQYFVVIPEADESNESIWDHISEKWKKLAIDNSTILYRKIPYKGLVGIIKSAKGIIGVTNSGTQLELMKKLEKITQE